MFIQALLRSLKSSGLCILPVSVTPLGSWSCWPPLFSVIPLIFLISLVLLVSLISLITRRLASETRQHGQAENPCHSTSLHLSTISTLFTTHVDQSRTAVIFV